MGFSVPAYGASNSKVKGVASGYDHSTKTGDNTFDIYFKDGSKVSLTIPQPELDEDKIEEQLNELTDEIVAQWLEENKEDIKGKDGKTVQVKERSDEPIEESAVLIFDPNEVVTQDNYSKVQADVRFAKAVDVGNKEKLAVSTWKDLVEAINDTYGRGMGAYRFEVDETRKALTIVCRNGVEIPIDISQIILNTNIEEFKDMLVTNLLDGQSLVYNASKKKWVNKSIDSSGMLVEAKKYTDDEIAKFNNKGSMAVDEKPTYYGGVITYKKGGETKTTEETGTWFYYYDDNHLAVQTIYIEGTEFTIAMAGDINLDDYVAKSDLIDVVDENFIDKTKIPTTKYMEEFKGILDDEISEKVNTTDIEDSLTSDATDKPLSAKQGKELKSQIDGLIDDTADKTVEDKTYSAKKIAEAIDGVNPSWNGTKAEFEALDKSKLKDGQTVNLTDDWKATDTFKFPSGDGFYLDEKDGVRGYNTSPTRGADTFFPFNNFKILNYVVHPVGSDGTNNDTFEVEKNGRYIVIGNTNADGRANSTLTISVDNKTPLETKREDNQIGYATDNVRRTNNIHQYSIYDLQKGDVIKCSAYVYGYGASSFTVIGIG